MEVEGRGTGKEAQIYCVHSAASFPPSERVAVLLIRGSASRVASSLGLASIRDVYFVKQYLEIHFMDFKLNIHVL